MPSVTQRNWIFTAAMAILGVALILAVARYMLPPRAAGGEPSTDPAPVRVIRIGLAPEGDIFLQRKAYLALKAYLEDRLSSPKATQPGKPPPPITPYEIQLKTASSYAGLLEDFREGHVDVAFMGSLLAMVAIDRYDGQVALKSEGALGFATYSGQIFVAESSPAKNFEDLRGKRIGAVRTTMGGAVFPLYLIKPGAGNPPELVWSGTHDDVIREVVAGNLEAGAVKDLRLKAYLAANPQVKLRILAESARLPNNALVFQKNFPVEQRNTIVRALLNMIDDPAAAQTLAAMKVKRYLPCDASEYGPLYQMIDAIGPRWSELNIEGPPPRIKKTTTPPEGT